MASANDWRLTNQEKYLQGVALRYSRYSKPPECNHHHCCFCWAKFMDEQDPNAQQDSLHEGYTTLALNKERNDECYWICSTCFNDFRDQFKWQIAD